MNARNRSTLSTLSVLALVCAVALSAQAQSYSDVVLSDNPAAYYRLDELSGTTAKDAVGVTAGTPNGRNPAVYEKIGTDPSGGFTLGQPGVINSPDASVSFNRDTSVLFPPSYGRVFAATTTGLPGRDSPFTLESWIFSNYQGDVNPGGLSVDRPNIAAFGPDAINEKNGLQLLRGTSGQPLVGDYFYGNDYFFNVPDLTGARHYLAVTYSGAGTQTLTLYLDGSAVGTQTVTGTPNIQQGDLEIGVLSPFAQNSFDGRIDEVAIYGADLSTVRIEAHYLAGIAAVPEPGTVVWLMGALLPGAALLRRRGTRRQNAALS